MKSVSRTFAGNKPWLMRRLLPCLHDAKRVLRWLPCCALFGFLPAAEQAHTEATQPPTVTIDMRDGSTLVGGLVELTDERTVLRLTTTIHGRSMSADRLLTSAEIVAIHDVHSDYQARSAACAGSGTAHATLATWCLANQLTNEGRSEAHAALAIDAQNAAAIATLHRLNEVRVNGAWSDLDSWLAQHALVHFDGIICDAVTRNHLRSLNAERTTDAQGVTSAMATQAHQVTTIRDGKERVVKLQGQRAGVLDALTHAATVNATVEAAKRTVEAASQQVKSAEAEAARWRKNTDTGPSRLVTDAQDAEHKAQEALKTAESAAHNADPATARKRAEDLEKSIQAAISAVQQATDAQAGVDMAVKTAVTKATASSSAYASARQQVHTPTGLPADVLVAIADQASAI